MKRILSIFTTPVVILLFLPLILDAQDVKTEKKIKVIVDDGSGKKVIIDTLLTGDSDIQTVKTSDGKIIWIGSDSPDHMKDEKGLKHVTVTVTSDDDVQNPEGHNSVAVWTEKGENSDVEKVIVVKKVQGADTHMEKSYDVMVTTDGDESKIDKTRYVVAKDGLVVTVEGEDDAKAKELMKLIEGYMGVKDKSVKTENSGTKKKSSK